MPEQPSKPDPNATSFLRLLKEWQDLVLSAATTTAMLLAVVFGVDRDQMMPAGIVVVLVGSVIGVLVYRRTRRSRQLEAGRRAEQDTRGDRKTRAFKGLLRFSRGENLPGKVRQWEAGQLLTQILQPDFELAIVTGQSGTGKSSLLECALVGGLAENSIASVIENANLLLEPDEGYAPNEVQIAALCETLRRRIVDARQASGVAVVLILDQFEEILARVQDKPMRQKLGRGIGALFEENVGVVIGIRKEYYVDFLDVAREVGKEISSNQILILEDFSREDAAEVIVECARQDGLQMESALATRVASDLAADGRVRPADLQIVCQSLAPKANLAEYRRQGGVAGLRTKFIRNAIDFSGDKAIARTVLRAFCDFANLQKVAEPMTLEQILARSRLDETQAERALKVLKRLERDRILARTEEIQPVRWSLLNDYLVTPIRIATEDMSNRAEAAFARLGYYSSSSRLVPPVDAFRLWLDIRGSFQVQREAVKLLWKSMLVGFGSYAGIVGLMLALLLVLAAERRWTSVDELSHWNEPPDGGRANYLRVYPFQDDDREYLLVGFSPPIGQGAEDASVWDTRTGGRIGFQNGRSRVMNSELVAYEQEIGRLEIRRADGEVMSSHVVPDYYHSQPGPRLLHSESPWLYLSQGEGLLLLERESGAWYRLGHDRIAPPDAKPGQLPTVRSLGSTLHAVRIDGPKMSRVTIWSTDTESPLFDEQFERNRGERVLFRTTLHTSGVAVLFSRGVSIVSIVVLPTRNEARQGSVLRRREIQVPAEFVRTQPEQPPASPGGGAQYSLRDAGRCLVFIKTVGGQSRVS